MKTILLLVSTIILSTCSNSKKNLDMAVLFGKDLNVVSVNSNDVSELKLTIQLNNTDQSVNGFAGCNRFFGSYSIDTSSISFKKISSTKMFCKDSNINKVEKTFLNLLSSVTQYKAAKNETIQLLDENNEVLITLNL